MRVALHTRQPISEIYQLSSRRLTVLLKMIDEKNKAEAKAASGK